MFTGLYFEILRESEITWFFIKSCYIEIEFVLPKTRKGSQLYRIDFSVPVTQTFLMLILVELAKSRFWQFVKLCCSILN